MSNPNLSELHTFKNHPFEVHEDEEMRVMVSSARDKGVTQPATVHPREDDGYDLVSGRRHRASKLAGVLYAGQVVAGGLLPLFPRGRPAHRPAAASLAAKRNARQSAAMRRLWAWIYPQGERGLLLGGLCGGGPSKTPARLYAKTAGAALAFRPFQTRLQQGFAAPKTGWRIPFYLSPLFGAAKANTERR